MQTIRRHRYCNYTHNNLSHHGDRQWTLIHATALIGAILSVHPTILEKACLLKIVCFEGVEYINEILRDATAQVEDVNIDKYNVATSGTITWTPSKDCFFYGSTYSASEQGHYPDHYYNTTYNGLELVYEDNTREQLAEYKSYPSPSGAKVFVYVPNGAHLEMKYLVPSATRYEAQLKGTAIYIEYNN